jgi:RHS repeat-associated protein
LGYRNTTVYNPTGTVLETIDALGYRSTMVYDAVGRMTASVDALGNRSTTVYDAAGRVSASQNALGAFTTQVYDVAGQRLASVNALGYRTSFAYDPRGMRTLVQDPLNRRTTSTFDALGRTATTQDARNYVTTYAYDAIGQSANRVQGDGARVTWSYDALGRATVVADAMGLTTQTYDALSRLSTVNAPMHVPSRPITYTYDSVGNRATMLDPQNGRTTYSWDARNSMSGMVSPFAERTTLAYDALGREQNRVLGNGLSTTTIYDALGQITNLANRLANGTGVSIFTTTYDGAGNPTAVQELDGARVTYTYDALYQLVNENRSGANSLNTTYAYDSAQRRTVKNASGVISTTTFDAADQVTTVQTGAAITTYTFDSVGNRQLVQDATGVTTMTWNADNRMATMVQPGGTPTTSTYNAEGLLCKTVQGATQTLNVYDGPNIIVQTNETGGSPFQFVTEPDGYSGPVSNRQSGVSRFYANDPFESVRQLLAANGSTDATYAYSAYGEELIASAIANPYRYVGGLGYNRLSSGFYQVRERELDAATGSWYSVDPVESELRYGYVGGRVPMGVDPSGMVCSIAPQKPCPSRQNLPPKMQELINCLNGQTDPVSIAKCLQKVQAALKDLPENFKDIIACYAGASTCDLTSGGLDPCNPPAPHSHCICSACCYSKLIKCLVNCLSKPRSSVQQCILKCDRDTGIGKDRKPGFQKCMADCESNELEPLSRR